MTASTIDSLFSVLENPLLLRKFMIVRSAPILALFTILCWLIPLAALFPPGALTVASESRTSSSLGMVPTFDPSYVGDGSHKDMARLSLGVVELAVMDPSFAPTQYRNVPISFNYSAPKIYLERMAKQVLLRQEIPSFGNRCGANCSYTLRFPGPAFDCTASNSTSSAILNALNESTDNQTEISVTTGATSNDTHYDPVPIYIGTADPIMSINGSNSPKFTIESLSNYTQNSDLYISSVSTMTCLTHRADYTVTVSFDSRGQQTINRTINHTNDNLTSTTGELRFAESGWEGRLPWNAVAREAYTKLNIAAIADALNSVLSGTINYHNAMRSPLYDTLTVNRTMILDSALNGNATGSIFTSADVNLNLSPRIYEQMLENLTISVTTLDNYRVNTTITRTESRNIYTLSKPANLIAPYASSLVLGLAFLVLGAFALQRNGVAASSGGFFQILVTTVASDRLRDAAAGGCLGGEERVFPQN
ncbi:MAG: hypothetical protein M1837_005688 [Sclerophora amabilis]|nr:MAG: hypothetical protein M1837_005688 [Sclerophora amabilis]